MKIWACVTLARGNIISNWELRDGHIVIQQAGDEAIAIPLDKSKIQAVEPLELLTNKIIHAPPHLEHAEAVADSLARAYLGTLNISEAVLIQIPKSN